MALTKQQRIKEFKSALAELLEDFEPDTFMPNTRGLCAGIDERTSGKVGPGWKDCSYDIMLCLLTIDEFNDGLDTSYCMTEDRWYFGQFLLSLKTEEFLDFMKAEKYVS